jgi:ribulose-phosphate 3-epimerase
VTLSVGILGADLLRLGEQLDRLGRAGVELLHVDVMDGVFCPQMTVGPPLVAALPKDFVVDVHLMIDEPLDKVDAYVQAGARILTFHIESTRHPHRVLQSLDDRGLIRGLALNPGTPVASVAPLLDDVELLLVLAINPGWSGQVFIPATAARLAEARELIGDRRIVVGVDGGVTRDNVERVAALGPDLIVAGSAIFSGGDISENARAMLAATAGLRGLGQPPAQTT